MQQAQDELPEAPAMTMALRLRSRAVLCPKASFLTYHNENIFTER